MHQYTAFHFYTCPIYYEHKNKSHRVYTIIRDKLSFNSFAAFVFNSLYSNYISLKGFFSWRNFRGKMVPKKNLPTD
jgi:hypothetical protein